MKARKNDSATVKPAKTKSESARVYSPTDKDKLRHEVELKAYYNFLDRKHLNRPGNELSDWLEAEKLISKNMTGSSIK